MKKINITINGINVTKKFRGWKISQKRKSNPQQAAYQIDEFLKDKGLGYAVAAIPDEGNVIYLEGATGLFVDESCVPQLIQNALDSHPDFRGQIYSDGSMSVIISKWCNGSKLVYETAV